MLDADPGTAAALPVQPPCLMIATHTHGSVTPAFAASLARAARDLTLRGVPVVFNLPEDSLVARGRNRAAADMLDAPDVTHLMFVDADIDFTADDICRLIDLGQPIAVAAYRKKQERHEYAVTFLPDSNEALDVALDADGQQVACRIARAATGFMLIERRVFETLASTRPDIGYVDYRADEPPRQMWDFFPCGVRSDRRFWSEDYQFCEMAREAGFPVWLRIDITLGHWGAFVWRSNVSDQFHKKGDPDAATPV